VARTPSKRASVAQPAPAASAPPSQPASSNGRTSPAPRRRNSQRTAANQSLGKGLQILDYFRHHGQGRLSDLAAYAGLNASTALRLALALQAHGAIVRQPGMRTYTLGSWILELASSLLREQPLVLHAHDILVRLRDETGETASLYVRDGPSRICLDRAESRAGLRSGADIGARLPPHRGAAGKVLLAYLAPDEREAVLRQVEAASGEDLAAVRRELEQIPAQGYSLSRAEREPGVGSVAVPIIDPLGHVAATINLSGPLARFTVERMRAAVPAMQQAASQLSVQMFLKS
jgi:DNA-binding IclR family transcriptional regulator